MWKHWLAGAISVEQERWLQRSVTDSMIEARTVQVKDKIENRRDYDIGRKG